MFRGSDERFQSVAPMLQLDFGPALTEVRIHRCGYFSQCKARGCLTRATLIAEKVDTAGRYFRQIECARRQIVTQCERSRGLEICDRRDE